MIEQFNPVVNYLVSVGYYLSFLVELFLLAFVVYFVGKHKFALEIKPSLDFQEQFFPNIKKNYFDALKNVFHLEEKSSTEEKQYEETITDASPDPAASLEELFPKVRRSNVSVHDAPLWILSYTLLLIIVVVYNIVNFFAASPDPQEEQVSRSGLIDFQSVADSFLDFISDLIGLALPTLSGYLLSLMFYTLVGTILMVVIARILFRRLNIHQVQIQGKESETYERIRKIWSWQGFTDATFLKQSAWRWLLIPVFIYLIVVLFVDYAVFVLNTPISELHFAMLHLLLIIIPRYFSELWNYPVKFVRSRQKVTHKVPLDLLSKWLEGEGYLHSGPEFLEPNWKRISLQEDSWENLVHNDPANNPILAEAFNFLNIKALYPNQQGSWRVLNEKKESLILAAIPHSGKSTFAFLTLINEAIVNGGCSLVIYPDKKRLNHNFHIFRQMLMHTVYHSNLSLFNMADDSFLSESWPDKTPAFIFADLDSLEDRLLAGWQGKEYFLNHLSLLIFEDIGVISGVEATNFYFFYKRLLHAKNCISKFPLRILVTLPPVFKNYTSIEELFSTNFQLIEFDFTSEKTEYKIGLVPQSSIRFDLNPTPTVATRLAAGLHEAGYVPAIVNRTTTRFDLQRELALSASYAVNMKSLLSRKDNRFTSVLDISFENVLNAFDHIKLINSDLRRNSHVCFAVYEDCSLTRQIIENKIKRNISMKGRFVFAKQNPLILRKNLRLLLSDYNLSFNELVEIYGETLIHHALNYIRLEGVLNVDKDEKYFVQVPKQDNSFSFQTLSSDTRKIKLFNKETNSELFRIDRDVAGTFLYPGKVFQWDQWRMRVPFESYQNIPDFEDIELQAEDKPIFTTKISEFNLSLNTKPDDVLTEIAVGEAPLYYCQTEFCVSEKMLGFREWGSGECIGEYHYERLGKEPFRNTFLTPGILVFFHESLFEVPVADEGKQEMEDGTIGHSEEPDDENNASIFDRDEHRNRILHGVCHLLKAVLAVFYYQPFDRLDVIIPDRIQSIDIFVHPENDVPLKENDVLAIFDTYPHGAGYIDSITPQELIDYLSFIKQLLEEIPGGLDILNFAYCPDVERTEFTEADLENIKRFFDRLLPKTLEMPRLQDREVSKRIRLDPRKAARVTEQFDLMSKLPEAFRKDYELLMKLDGFIKD